MQGICVWAYWSSYTISRSRLHCFCIHSINSIGSKKNNREKSHHHNEQHNTTLLNEPQQCGVYLVWHKIAKEIRFQNKNNSSVYLWPIVLIPKSSYKKLTHSWIKSLFVGHKIANELNPSVFMLLVENFRLSNAIFNTVHSKRFDRASHFRCLIGSCDWQIV